MYIGTMHSIWKRFISENIEKSKFMSEFEIFEDDDEQLFFIFKNIKKFMNLKYFAEYKDNYQLYTILNLARQIKNQINAVSENAIDIKNIESSEKIIEYVKSAYILYEELLIEENMMDFAYLQVEFCDMLLKDRELFHKLNQDIHYIMVDEYQDSNKIQEKFCFCYLLKEKISV